MAVKPDDKGAARLARPGAAFKQYWVLFIGNITAAQPFEYSLERPHVLAGRSPSAAAQSAQHTTPASSLKFCSTPLRKSRNLDWFVMEQCTKK